MKQLLSTTLIILITGCLFTGCSSKDADFFGSDKNEQELYRAAKVAADNARFAVATRNYQELETRYPFSAYTLQASLDLAYAFMLHGHNEDAVKEAEKFIRFNPTHPSVDYAYYIRGVANFGQRKMRFTRWIPRDSSDFEQTALRDAFNDFAFILKSFPESKYAADARKRMIFLRNTFAKHEINVAKYYVTKSAWVAAINRANRIIKQYSDTPANREALEILIQGYRALGLDQAVKDTERVLRFNYPDHTPLQADQPLAENTQKLNHSD